MGRKKKAMQIWPAVFLCLALVCGVVGDWDGVFINGSGADYFEFPMDVDQDGSVSLETTAASTFLNQFSSTRVCDQSGNTIDFNLLMTSPTTLVVPLAAGSYLVRIGRGLPDKYGVFNITATLAPANAGATEIENNDVIGAASTNPGNRFSGAIGHWRIKDVKDLSDYYCFTLTGDTNVHFDLEAADTLLDFDTVLTLRNGSNIGMGSTYLTNGSMTWDLHLAAGTYYLRLYTHDYGKYGGYNIFTTATPAVSPSSEKENNDTIAAANPIKSTTLLGSIGYFRDKNAAGTEDWDNIDYFSCQVAQGGTLSVEILPATTLYSINNVISIRDAGNTQLDYDYLTGSPRTVTVNNLDAGTYYIRVSRSWGYGAYQINISGNVILPSKSGVGAIMPLLLTE